MLSALEKKSCCICSFDWIDQFGNDIGTTVYNNKIKSPLNLTCAKPEVLKKTSTILIVKSLKPLKGLAVFNKYTTNFL